MYADLATFFFICLVTARIAPFHQIFHPCILFPIFVICWCTEDNMQMVQRIVSLSTIVERKCIWVIKIHTASTTNPINCVICPRLGQIQLAKDIHRRRLILLLTRSLSWLIHIFCSLEPLTCLVHKSQTNNLSPPAMSWMINGSVLILLKYMRLNLCVLQPPRTKFISITWLVHLT